MKWAVLTAASALALATAHSAQASPVLVDSTAAFAVFNVRALDGQGQPAPYLAPDVRLTFTPIPRMDSAIITANGTGALAALPAMLPVLLNGAAAGQTSSVTVTIGQAFNFTIPSWGAFAGLISDVRFTGGPTTTNRVLDFVSASGRFTPVCDGLSLLDCNAINPALFGFQAGNASATFSATQTGASRPGAAVSSSFTFAWVAPYQNGGGDPGIIPAPAGLALFGLALVGLGLVRRTRHGAAG